MSENTPTVLPIDDDHESDWEYEYSQTETEVRFPRRSTLKEANDKIELLRHPRSLLCLAALP